MKGKFTRRQLLRHGIALGALTSMGRLSLPSVAYANSGPTIDRNFIFCHMAGGWDTFLGLDPKDPDIFTDERKYETRIELGFHMLPSNRRSLIQSNVPDIVFGPYIGKLKDYADKMAIIRGMSVDSLGHKAGAARFITGKPPSGNNARGSSMATILADRYETQADADMHRLISNLCIRTSSYNTDRIPKATGTKLWSLDDLFDFVEGVDAPFDSTVSSQIDQFLQDNVDPSRSEFLDKALAFKVKAKEMTGLNLREKFDMDGSTAEILAARDAFELGYNERNTVGFNDPNYRLATAARAIVSGVSRCVSVEVIGTLDSHFDWSRDQGREQQKGFDAMANLIAYLDSIPHSNGGSYLDHTTILCFSEMGRKPMLINDGRNHNRNTSCFLAGAGIAGGTIIGASSDIGAGCQKVDLTTGTLSATGDIVRPEHIHRALLHGIGVTDDVADLRVSPLTAILS